jgi:benzoate membrane transport protein
MDIAVAAKRPLLGGSGILRDFDQASLWAACTAAVWYFTGITTLMLAVGGQLGFTDAQTTSSVAIVWITSAVGTLGLALVYRQPIAITTNSVGLIYLGTLAGRFTYEELAGAYLLTGMAFVALSLHRVCRQLVQGIPLTIMMGVVAGSFLDYGTRLVSATLQDAIVAGAAVAGYLAGRAWNHSRVPPVGLGILAGGLAVVLAQRTNPVPLPWVPPTLIFGEPALSAPAVIAATIPLVLLMVGRDYVPALGFLVSQGYSVPARAVMAVVGLGSLVNAFFGGPPSTVSRDGGAILAGPEAGRHEGRYWSSVVVSFLMLAMALAAGSAVGLVALVPKSFITVLAGLAILGALHSCLEVTFSGPLRFGALVAFVVAATPFSLLGITSACWALVIGLAASLLVERRELTEHWRARTGDS